ncbi:MAG: hypothetical protein WBD90_17475 [Xanthobacteraceae bacterium]
MYSKPGIVSASAGTSGSCGMRSGVDTASALSLPLFTGSIRSDELPKCM